MSADPTVASDAESSDATNGPLHSLSVQLADDEVATVAAGQWLRWLGASVRKRDDSDAAAIVIGGKGAVEGSIVVRMTSPFDESDAEVPDDGEIARAVWARSGMASLARADRAGEPLGAPCWPTTTLPQSFAGAALAMLAAAWGIAAGRMAVADQPAVVELDLLELLCLLPMQPIAAAQFPMEETPRAGGAVGGRIGGRVEADGGSVYLRLVEPAQWQRLLQHVPGAERYASEVAGRPTLLDDHAPEIDALVRRWAAAMKPEQLLDLARSARVPVAPIVGGDDLARDVHLIARGFADGQRIGGRAAWAVVGGRDRDASRQLPRLAPTADQPLRGCRVLDLSWAWAGPFATTLLAELGAEILNIEWDPRPSNLRVQGPAVEEFGIDGGGWWSANQRGKRSIALDLKHPRGRSAAIALAKESDAVIENFSPGVADRLGLGFEDLIEHNPRLAYVSMSAYGASGPRSSELGYGPHLYASAGYADQIRSADGDPSQMLFPIADPISGLIGALALIGHLVGDGALHLDVAEVEATCAVAGRRLGDGGSPVPPIVRTVADSIRDGYLADRDFWMLDRTAALAGRGVRIARAPWRIDGRRTPEPRGAPRFSDDTRRCLVDVLGWDDAQVEGLLTAGAGRERSD